MQGVGGAADISITKLKVFKLSGVAIPGLQFIVGGSETGGAGTIGANVLGFRDAEYDLAHGAIRLMEHRGCEQGNLAYWAAGRPYSMLALEDTITLARHIVGVVTVNGVRMRAMFDTGASRSGLSIAAAVRAGVHVTDPGVEDVGAARGFGRRTVRSWIAPFKSFAVGEEEIRSTRLRIVDYGDQDFDMLVGADFFLSHHVYVSPSLRRMFFTYEGGPVFDLSRKPRVAAAGDAASLPASVTTPEEAGEFARRGAASAARGSLAPALADLDRAVALAPREPGYLFQRAGIRAASKDMAGARADLEAGLALRPNDPEGLLARAGLRHRDGDEAGARADADRIASTVASQADIRLELGSLYEAMEVFGPAIQQLTLWIDAHPVDSRVPTALNERCWARALAGRELPQALADCNTAVRRSRSAAEVLDSRGLVQLRMGSYDAALADYARALSANPNLAWSRYGRGLARIAKGQRAEGAADLAAAAALEPDLPARARRYGIVPAG